MMVEPPGDFRRRGIFEIDDGVFVAIEMRFVKQRSRPMHKSGEDKLGILANALAIKTGKDGGGRRAVETFVVIEDSDFQMNAPVRQKSRRRKSLIAVHFERQGKAYRNDSLEEESQGRSLASRGSV